MINDKQFKNGKWDSAHFNIAITKIYPQRLLDIGHIYDNDLIIVATRDNTLIPALETIGFRYITTKVIIQRRIIEEDKTWSNEYFREMRYNDIDKCARIVSDALIDQSPYTLSAKIFNKGSILTRAKILDMYYGWFKRICNNKSSICVCFYNDEDEPRGVIASEIDGLKAINELFAVDKDVRGMGIGTLLGKALFSRLPINCIFEGVINLHNLAPINLWCSLGAKIDRVEYVLHKWR